MRTLRYIYLLLLLIVALKAAGQSYVIDKVCLGAERHYRIDGEPGTTYIWQLTDISGNQVNMGDLTGVNFSVNDPSTGQSRTGSEVIIRWIQSGIFKLSAVQYSTFGCDTLQQGEVQVFEQPKVFAGNPQIICIGSAVVLSDATASNFSSLIWSSSGDGAFNNNSVLNPTYTPGENDQLSGKVTLTITAQGNGSSNSCNPVISSVPITINSKIIPVFNQIGPLYQNSTPPVLPAISSNLPAITGLWNPASISTKNNGITTYTFTPNPGQCALPATMDIVVASQITPTFGQIGPFCQNSIAPALPTLSTNNPPIKGMWNPATINTSSAGITNYVFTPDTTQNAIGFSMNVEITSPVNPVFTPIGPVYEHSTPPNLPASSNNVPPVTGSWTPAVINTASVNVTTYIFNPDSGQCALKSSLQVTVMDQLVPVFISVGPFCQYSIAPALPSVSGNGITGTWNPSRINTSIAGVSIYRFTPDGAQNSEPIDITIIITSQVTPTFAPIGPMCQNSLAPVLPATSLNGITGTWSPATISTIGTGTTTYTFTPDGGQCAASATLDVVITTSITPTFAPIGPICQNSPTPLLPAISLNGITGTWSPATISTIGTGTTTYTFTPDGGQCAASATLDVVITTSITPTFAPIGPICQNSPAPVLLATSLNGITGTWSPATISTANVGTAAYTFTPDGGQCAASAILDVVVTTSIEPAFATIGPICQNSLPPQLPPTSLNGITGTWSPATISTIGTGTTTYTFTPDGGQCAASATLDVVITTSITPTFAPIGPICQNSPTLVLPATSLNGITGTWSPATISTANVGTAAYTFTPDGGQCAESATIDVVVTTSITPTFTVIGPICQNSPAPVLPATSLNGITGKWSPATISTIGTGTTTYTFTPDGGQCAASATLDVVITTSITPTFAVIGPICQNSPAPLLPATSLNGITGTWSPATISTANVGTAAYTFTPDGGQCAASANMDIVVTTSITPTFASIGPICQNSPAPLLPATSLNGITGTWSPAAISTANVGTAAYTFTADGGQCAASATLDIVVTTSITPTFASIGPICQNSLVPVLPATSLNGITGTWSPATISTANVGTAAYTFTPDGGQCAASATLDVVITTSIIPTFAPIGPICQNSPAPLLPATSLNGITGTWSPATISTIGTGTTTYTFTPDGGQCAASANMDIVVTTSIEPAFATIGPICQNSPAPVLPATSLNGITGTWSPATISTIGTGTTTYKFTPDGGQCAGNQTMDISVTTSVTPTFAPIGPICQNSPAPLLPATSLNGIAGTWSPATISTIGTGTTTYTFTPDGGQCAASATLDVVITTSITPTFAVIGPICQNSPAPLLPATSLNGITGTWSPATISTIETGTTTYTFTPDGGQCAGNQTMDISVTTSITPTFAAIGPICQNSPAPVLPATSLNGITGTWSPATISTIGAGTTTYTFTPDGGQCAASANMDIVVTTSITPTFAPIGPICQNSPAPVLLATSLNGITGTWSPATISTIGTGTTTYTFTPDGGQCSASATLDVVITTSITPTFAPIGPICQNSPAPVLPATSLNGITGTWSLATISTIGTGTTTYTFTPDGGQCAGIQTMDISVTTSVTPTFAPISPICQNSPAPVLPATSLNGITGTWSPATISTANVGTAAYTFTPDGGQCAASAILDVVVTTSIEPAFATIGPICQNSPAPVLPATSLNGITGTWSPATISTIGTGTTTYTFTPDGGQCAASANMDIVVTTSITPTFAPIGPICQNSPAPVLPATSLNGITGTWSPATISTIGIGTTTYTFTPDGGQCAASATLDVVVTTSITPTFAPISPICQNSPAPVLPATSLNGITGTWSPATISTIGTGTTTYTFTPDGGQCSASANMDIVVTTSITPTFAAIGPICQNSPAPVLPATSLNGITGTWSPATISTIGTGTTTYTFTPDGGQCEASANMDIVVTTSITPTFASIGPICQNSPTPLLPAISLNGITGTWSPATISTIGTGTTTYTFTPDGGQCAASATLDVVVTTSITPTFAPISPICQNSPAPVLPATSLNGITGTWSPATISTANVGTAAYTFTPDGGQCAASAILDVVVTTSIEPAFATIGPICQNSLPPQLPPTSLNGITGTWSPATISTANVGTAAYTFTPDGGQCSASATLDVVITTSITPTFAVIGPICQNSPAPLLPATSLNGITGNWSPATISTIGTGTTTYTFTPDGGQCAGIQTMDISVTTSVTPTFAPISPICQNSPAPVLPATSLNGITGTWSPATISTANVGTAAYTFTPDGGQCAASATLDVVVTTSIKPTFAAIGPICQNSPAPVLPATSLNGITGTWSPATISTIGTGTTTYTFTPDGGQCAASANMDIVVTTSITPTFAPIGPICQNSLAPVLPATSLNGITGTWSPAAISTANVGTAAYTFTPDGGQCAASATLDVVITTSITPTFAPIGPICQNSSAPLLPTTSQNGITGTWSPATISTIGKGMTTYTFTPDGGQCAASVTLDVVITTSITPTFAPIGPICQNSLAPVLPATSLNGITGTWSPATISTIGKGMTTYTFTPDGGQCAASVTLDVVITTSITPTFAPIGPICQNSLAPVLPATSLNGITGTWSPATISTIGIGTTTHTFTPASGQCATQATMTITITSQVPPAFTAIGPLCQNSPAPVLPMTSTNGITGTWSPATISTATAGTRTYSFTPAAGQCATQTTMTIIITSQVSPAFTAIGPLCQNSPAPVLPITSTNGITGTWSPATISTATAGTRTYSFTPAAGQCATQTTMTITITSQVSPAFTAIGPLCQNSPAPVLPMTSTNGITGTWSPATISTATAGTRTYSFTPAAGQCATQTTMTIIITSQVSPAFTAIGPLCQNSPAPVLPITSTNGITGTWSPATISTATAGTITYTFTPATGQCSVPTSISITVINQITPAFTAIAPLCQNSPAPVLPLTSTNGITGTWSPATLSTATAGTRTYSFTPAAGQCANPITMTITITSQVSPAFTAIGPLCQNSPAPVLPITSTNGITGTWSPATISTATAGTITYTFTPATGQCSVPTSISITVINQITPAFTAIAPLCQNSPAPVLPLTSTNGITGTWSPATISTSTAGTRTYTFTPAVGQCAYSVTMSITTNSLTVPLFSAIDPICQNSAAPSLPKSSTNGINGTWNPATINTAVAGTSNYTFTPAAGLCASPVTIALTINPRLAPVFAPLGLICFNTTPPDLPAISTNGITGTWHPATINTSVAGTATYTFTPSGGQCTNPLTINVNVLPLVTPTFTAIQPICQNTTAPTLPLSSLNGVTGTWNPSVINVSVVRTNTYTFTPSAGQCANSETLPVTVTSKINPAFNTIGPLCLNSIPPALPLTSTNGISGTWNPSTISTSVVGKMSYQFTPNEGCALVTAIDITTTSKVTPIFTQIGPRCQNSVPPTLPLTSSNGIPGTWNPSTINTTTTGTSTYVFNPDKGECGTSTSMDIIINGSVTPTFDQIQPMCQNSVAPVLPVTSTNNIKGTWSPSTISTSAVGINTYTFTPDPGPCANKVTMDISITSPGIPVFTTIGPLCANSIPPSLPAISSDGISGTWSPASIRTASTGTFHYRFTPFAGQCATAATISITINPQITPTFDLIGPLCQNSAAPALVLQSTNNPVFTGTWNPIAINTSKPGNTVYTFIPAADQCATKANLNILVLQNPTSMTSITVCTNQLPYNWNGQKYNAAGSYSTVLTGMNGCDSIASLELSVIQGTAPLFTQIGPLLQNSVAPSLSVTSQNGITGKWNPGVINTANTGTTTYTFIPDSTQCATQSTMDITVQIDAIIAGSSISGICQQSNLDASKSVGDIVKYEWSVLDQGGIVDQPSEIKTNFSLSPTYTGSLPANFRVKLQITGRDGMTSMDTLTIRVDSPPVANVYSSGSIEKDGSMIIDGSVSTGTDIKYKWSTAEGKIVGPDNQSSAKLFGAGLYKLEVSDIHGCLDSKTFKYPLEFHSIIANPDFVRIAWDQDTTIQILNNDRSSVYLKPGSVIVTELPSRGITKVNPNGTVTYTPQGKETGFDKFVYEVCDTLDFCASATVTIEIYDIGTIAPEGFSPNGDGANDKMVFRDLVQNHPNSQLYVYTRSGQLVYQSLDYKNDWDGRMANHQLVPTGTYYFVLKITRPTSRIIKSFIYIGY